MTTHAYLACWIGTLKNGDREMDSFIFTLNHKINEVDIKELPVQIYQTRGLKSYPKIALILELAET